MTETGWSFPETLEQLAIASGYKDGITRGHFHVREKSPEQLAREAAAKKRQEEMDSKTLAKNKAWWNEAFSLNKPQAQPAILYFKNRGLAARVAALGDHSYRLCDYTRRRGVSKVLDRQGWRQARATTRQRARHSLEGDV
jgi:hypothetical protein